MKVLFFSLLFSVCCIQSSKAANTWAISQIPDSLLKNADAVIRSYTKTYTRKSIDKYSLTVDFVASIMNENGYSSSIFFVNYDNNSQVTDIHGDIIDSKGNIIKAIKKRDIEDIAYNNSYTIYSDNRIKRYRPSNNYYPYTVHYNYTIEFKSLVGFGAWLPQNWYNISTENAELIIKTPSEFELAYKELNGQFNFKQTEKEGEKIYKWSVSQLKAIPSAPLSPNYLDVFPLVLLSPHQISYEGKSGDFSSWKNYGEWVYKLTEGRQILPDETVKKIKELTINLPDKKEKIKAVYKYMQGKTRYVNISMGIGGFQPVEASIVDEKGYGDCKALSNYTKALLSCIDIPSYYTEIGSGKSRQLKYPNFSSIQQTNHAILCVPLENDTIWLECTNQNYPFGYIGGDNSDRYCLLISKEGGKLTKTPTYQAEQNTRNSTTILNLAATRHASFLLHSEFRNYLYENVFYLLNDSKEEQKKGLLKSTKGNGVKIDSFELTDSSAEEASASLNINGIIENYALKAGNRLFIEPNFLLPNSFIENINDDREISLYEPISYIYFDTLEINIPENYSFEFVPQNQTLDSDYGTFQISYLKHSTQQIQISRQIRINKGTFPPKDFQRINSFLSQQRKQTNRKIILNLKKEN